MVQFRSSDISMDFILIVFLIALWLLSYITTYSILCKHRIMSVLVLTVAYLAVINTFTDYNSNWAIVRTVLEGFLLLHLALASRIATPNRISADSLKRNGLFYHGFVILLLAVFVFSSLILPKKAPIFPDPVPTIKNALGINTTRTVGYSEDDTTLGGALKKDNATVFTARAEKGHYWRVESKTVYTGTGWANANSGDVISFSSGDNFPIQLTEQTTGATNTAEISFASSSDYMPYPYGTQAVNGAVDSFSANLTIERVGPVDTIKNYTVQLKTPVYNIEKMQNADFSTLSNAFVSQYTQTPKDLPDRVTKLANKVTKDADSIYDKTKAIESYLSTSGTFTYSTDDAKETPMGADYVDQFLFETQIGYCDNFSTSMVVMLRTLGIPARWAKGYTPGDGEKKKMMLKRLTQSQITMHILGRKYFSQVLDGFHLSQQQHSPILKTSKNQQLKQLINLKHLMIVRVRQKRQTHQKIHQNKITVATPLVKHRKKKNLKQKQRLLISKFRLGFGGFQLG